MPPSGGKGVHVPDSELWSTAVLACAVLAAGCDEPARAARPHPLPEVSDVGGPKLAQPQLVPIFFSDDLDVAALTSYSQWIVTSSWLQQAGADYGVGDGSVLGVVQNIEPAPDAIKDTEIVDLLFRGLADGTLPQPAGGGLGDVLYVVNFPAHTVVTAGTAGIDKSCTDFGGYHASARRNGVELAYAVIPTCPDFHRGLTELETREMATSHELIEAATDPLPSNHPGFQLRDLTSPWLALGGEVADLCARGDATDVWRDAGFVAQRSWSNAAAQVGDPCVPVPTDAPYYSVMTTGVSVPRVAPGGHVAVVLAGWAHAARPDWPIRVQGARAGEAMLTLAGHELGAGKSTTLDVAVLPATATGTTVRFFIYSGYATDSYQLFPMRAIADAPCASFSDCETCTSHEGCGFCASNGRCETQAASGSVESRCAATAFATWPGSCSGTCAGHSGSCADCASQPGCGWCASGGATACLEASHDQSEPATASCAYADWSVTPAYCPGQP